MFEFCDHVWPAITLANKDLGCSFSAHQISVRYSTKILSFITVRWLLPNLQVVNFANFFDETQIPNSKFLDFWSSDFSKIFSEHRGVNPLSTKKRRKNLSTGKNIRFKIRTDWDRTSSRSTLQGTQKLLTQNTYHSTGNDLENTLTGCAYSRSDGNWDPTCWHYDDLSHIWLKKNTTFLVIGFQYFSPA